MEETFNPNTTPASSEPSLIMITGGIGSGKSVVSRILRLNGYSVYDCDSEAKRIMETDADVIEALIDILGAEAYSLEISSAFPASPASSISSVPSESSVAPVPSTSSASSGRKINRGFIASRIFSDSTLRGLVNGVVHRAVREDVTRFADERGGTVFCETAIPVTSGMVGMCDSAWLITAPERERIERVKERNGFTEDEIARRIDAQREEFHGLDECKTVRIDNGREDLLLPQVKRLLSDSYALDYYFDNFIKN